MNQVPLEPEQVELLTLLVEATRSVPREQRQPIFFIEFMGGQSLIHPGIAAVGRSHYQPIRSDLETLAERGLIRMRQTDHSFSVDVRPEGFHYYEQMQARRGKPMTKTVTAAREYLDSESFRRRHEGAVEKWAETEQRLWSADSREADTTIGHLCREAMQLFAGDLASTYGVGVEINAQSTAARVRAILAVRIRSADRRAWADAMLAYWGTVADLTQRQEHGASRENQQLTWADNRRLVVQTLMVMYELDHELQLPDAS